MENQQQVVKKKGLEYWQQIIIMLCLGWAVIWIYRSALSPIFTELNLSLGGGISDSALGAISSFYFFGYTGMQIPAGILVDKFGKKSRLNSRIYIICPCSNCHCQCKWNRNGLCW